MRVFISSTSFDLIDVRAELASSLTAIGIVPVLSDDKLSDFRVQHNADSIETCLVNLESCDEVILILDQRYGPSLEGAGFPDVSATHLEYRKAKELSMPIQFFVRDRLAAEFAIWKRNKKREDIQLAWVQKPEDFGLFKLLDEHQRLAAASKSSNWYFLFTTSIDLKAAVAKYFQPRVLPQVLVDKIQSNAFPILHVEIEVESNFLNGLRVLYIRSMVCNIGGATAFAFQIGWEDNDKKDTPESIFVPGQKLVMTTMYCPIGIVDHFEKFLVAAYKSPIGIIIRDRFRVSVKLGGAVQVSGANLVERSYARCEPIMVNIDGL